MRRMHIALMTLLLACHGESPVAPAPPSMVGRWTGPISDDHCGDGTLILNIERDDEREFGRFFAGSYERVFPSAKRNCNDQEGLWGQYDGGNRASLVMGEDSFATGDCKWTFELQFVDPVHVSGTHERRDRSCNPRSGGKVSLSR